MSRTRWTILVAAAVVACWAGCDDSKDKPAPSPATSPARPASSSAAGTKTGKVREPAVAGPYLFYPADRQALTGLIDRLLAEKPPQQVRNLRALICPHAGIRFSGRTAAAAYRLLPDRGIRTVIVLAPSHYADFEGASIPEVDAYRTPLGLIPLAGLARELSKVSPFVVDPTCRVQRPSWWRSAPMEVPPFGQDTPHTWEHSLEVQLPFLQRALGEFTLAPVIFGRVDPQAVATVLAPRIDDGKTLLVASSDLSHKLPDARARELDDRCIQAICRLDVASMNNQSACGKGPILTLMHLAVKKGWKARLLDYSNSGRASGNLSAVVGYAAIAFYEAPKVTHKPLTAGQRRFLLELARKSLVEIVTNNNILLADSKTVPAALKEPRGCFITLEYDGKLRGCRGRPTANAPLYNSVIDSAADAARDARFERVKPEELEKIEIEISILTPLQPVDSSSPENLLGKIRPHTDGVVLSVARRGALYLPTVWKRIPDKEDFLRRLSLKAGLPADAWRRPEATVWRFQAEVFREGEK